MKETLETINGMQKDGVIAEYAIGGAVGATLYIEPSATFDVDVFVALPGYSSSRLVSLTPIYNYLIAAGAKAEGEHIVIGSWPVQFLVSGSALEDEGLSQAVETEVEGVRTRVMTAEHLVAIALQTGRAKDHSRILQFLEHDALDAEKLKSILERHGLTEKWDRFKQRYFSG